MVISAFVAAAAAAGDWPGWRGLEREGRAEPGDYPTQWSPEKNIRWKAPVRGKGHSSPVVAGDAVFVTTAYFTGRGEGIKRAAGYAVFGLTGLLIAITAVFALRAAIGRPRLARGQWVSVASLAMLLAALAWHAAADRLRPPPADVSLEQQMERWLLASTIAALCLMVAGSQFLVRPWLRPAIGLLALGFAALVLFGRPEPQYFDLVTPGRYGERIFETVALPFMTGVVLLVATGVERLRRRAATPADARNRSPWAFATSLAILVVGAALAVVLCRDLLLAAIVVCGLAWLVSHLHFALRRQVPNEDVTPFSAPRWLPAAFLCVGAFGFAERCYFLTTREFVRAVVCLDRDTGARRWTCEGLRAPQPPLNSRNSPATPTPVADGERVYAWFGSPGALCADRQGKLLWTNDEVPFDDVHGLGASPLLCDGLLIIPGTQPEAPYIAALDARTGERVWTTDLRPWSGGEGQHRTPAIATVDGKRLILAWAWDGERKEDFLRALDLRSGKELWRHPVATHGEQVAGLVSDDDVVFLPTSKKVHALSLSKLSRGEDPVIWARELKCKGQLVASPVLCNGLLFVVSAHRDAHCLDARTGELLWSRQLNGRGCMASPIAARNAVYFPDVSGKTTVVVAERTFHRVAENDLGEPIWASPAPVDGRLYLRTAGHLWCVGE
ncbi:MAG TPA: PQQ-binding-like beta-propeller repeat protein [Planctomycetota bacterium]|nr:PQQ-binding-like beta-propeller repeat protein [Planctomycetota bacterium]